MFIILIIIFFGSSSASFENFQPEQIHISLGDINEIVVTWITQNWTEKSIVQYGTHAFFDSKEEGVRSLYADGGDEHREFWVHRVHLRNLESDSLYYYVCGSLQGWSEEFHFKTITENENWSPRLAIYGDLGSENAQSLARLQEETERGLYDAIIHVGDFAYDMDTDNSRVGDNFMNQIQPIAAYVPYMVCAGNHEQKYNFSNYRARFSMPNYEQTENLFYSWNLGPAHFIMINTEAYYFLNYGLKLLTKQYEWLKKDLKVATEQNVRKKRPWIIILGHRPMYCSGRDNDDCFFQHCSLRIGLPILKWFGLEEMLFKYGVDLAIWAHEHNYERLWPIHNYQVLNGSLQHPYTNPRAPIHFVTGSAGCSEEHTKFRHNKPEWSAFRDTDYGYTRLTVLNHSHLYWEQVSDDKGGKIIDRNWIIQDKHESFAKN